MFKRIFILLISVIIVTGCSTLQNLADNGMADAQAKVSDLAANQLGGSAADILKMKGDKEKMTNLLPFYVLANKLCEDKKITEKQRDDFKVKFDDVYTGYKAGKYDLDNYKAKCEQILKKFM
ncbi:MAG: hypothetical protein WC055_14335 [Melioribacteraceae bacterium]